MTADLHALGPFVRRFLLEEVVAHRNLSRNTQLSYRDAIRLLLGFLAQRHATDPARVTVEQVTAPVVRAFLAYLQDERANAPATRNQRLAAIHALFRFISRQAPELVEHASSIQAIPPQRTATPTMPYLDKHEIDALLAVPNRLRPQGRRDYALLLFLYNSGARASQAAALTIADLALDTAFSVRLFGKGRKTRICPLWPHTAAVLREILDRRLDGPKQAPVFLNVRGQPITRYGVHALVARAAQKAAATTPCLRAKRVSPHTLRHTTAGGEGASCAPASTSTPSAPGWDTSPWKPPTATRKSTSTEKPPPWPLAPFPNPIPATIPARQSGDRTVDSWPSSRTSEPRPIPDYVVKIGLAPLKHKGLRLLHHIIDLAT